MNAAGLYTWLAARPLTARGMWLNLGYWREATEIDTASEALAMLVAEAGRMAPGDEVVDVGFGFADQDMLWAERIGPRRITGLNVTPLQVKLGRERVARRGLEGVVELREGSATAMPLPDASADLVIALECAFHFEPRVEFFAEAFRVLRPGGRLVTADIIRGTPEGLTIDKLLRAQVAIILFASAYLAEVIRGGLQAIPKGQGEAADALGLGYWHKTLFITLPQALRIVIPPLVNTFIGLFKDTSLVVIIGIYDILNAAKTSIIEPAWRGFGVEAYVTVACIFFIFCFAMSKYSQKLEVDLNRGMRR